jgi:hypothetical protein
MITAEDMNKDVTVQVRLTAEEHKRWLAAAEAEGRTLSNWIRRQCNAQAPSIDVIEYVEKRAAERKAKKGGR